jgi:hypothetical protein
MLRPYYADDGIFYCKHLNEKNLELNNILTAAVKYITSIRIYVQEYYTCVECIPSSNFLTVKRISENKYKICELTVLPVSICTQCEGCIDYASVKRYILFGKYMSLKYCKKCFIYKWKTRACEDCSEKNSNDLFKTICNTCLSKKSNELNYCVFYLDYNMDITNIIINKLQEIKNYLVIKN